VTLRVYKPSTRYFDEFLRCSCAPDLARLKLYPNGKELTESFSMYRAVVKLAGPHRLKHRIRLIDVGCGSQPRNAALFAHRSRWDCIAVDPALHSRWCDPRRHMVARLDCMAKRIEECNFESDVPTVVVMVHAHVSVPVVMESVPRTPVLLVAMPCCVPHGSDRPPDYSYYDHGCWSPKRQLHVWDWGFREAVKDLS
jgi:hypothetical protein